MIKHLTVLILSLVMGGCSAKTPRHKDLTSLPSSALICQDKNTSEIIYDENTNEQIADKNVADLKNVSDLERFPQVLNPYCDQNVTMHENLLDIQLEFDKHYYRPWSYTTAPVCLQEASWPIRSFTGGYGSNLLRVDPAWIKELIVQSNFAAYSTINRYAIATKWMNMRVFPTHKPLYNNPALAGEGYPFDLLQNSSVMSNEPLFLSHYSLDGAWAYIFSNSASGWVPSEGVAILDEQQIRQIQDAQKVFIDTDKIPLLDKNKRFIAYSRIGMVLPLVRENDQDYIVSMIKDENSAVEVTLSKSIARLGVRPLQLTDLEKIGSQMLKNTYGWGGMFEERDCSSMIRDMYTPFGIWLPRNSSMQSKKGEIISFKGLSNTEKLALIKDKGIPFETILYKQGHVLLYIGMYEENPMVLHNIWGIKTIDKEGKRGRVIVGKTVVSTLTLGSEVENFDYDNMLLTKLSSMNIFTHSPIPVVLAPKIKRKGTKVKL